MKMDTASPQLCNFTWCGGAHQCILKSGHFAPRHHQCECGVLSHTYITVNVEKPELNPTKVRPESKQKPPRQRKKSTKRVTQDESVKRESST